MERTLRKKKMSENLIHKPRYIAPTWKHPQTAISCLWWQKSRENALKKKIKDCVTM